MTDYCTQADVEKYLNITFGMNPDPTVALWITAASAKIDVFCNRDFDLHSSVVEYYDGQGKWSDLPRQRHTVVRLRNWPVTEVTEVVDDGTTLTEGDHYEVYLEQALIRLIPETRYFTKKAKGIKVTYSYGYASVPTVVKDVCRWLVGESLKKQIRFSEAGTAASISLDGESLSYPEIVDIPEHLKELLQPYRKWEFG